MNDTLLLKVNGLGFSYRSRPVLKGVEFAVREHELLAILGPNGVGKTTLLKSINAILRPDIGSILIEDDNVLELDRMAIARRIGYVPQRSEAGRMTAFDAILLGRRPHIGWKTTEHDLKLVQAAIDSLHLGRLALRYLDEMSGGELQKICIARAIVQQPKVLLLDEPTSSLDLKNQLEILDLLRTIVRGHPVSAVMTMHDLNLALRYADKFLFIKDGIVFAAGGREVVTPETIAAVYDVAVAVEHWRGCPVIIPIHQEGTL